MGLQTLLNDHTAACRELGKVELHFQQGHASQDELEAARAAAHKTQAAMILAVNAKPAPLPAEDQPAGHEHDSSCGHTAENTVRVGYILIESFIGEDSGNVLHMETHDGSHNPIQFDLAMMMMTEAAGMLLVEMFGSDGPEV
jgi:hypothetical protein